jgi:hypothetical protein
VAGDHVATRKIHAKEKRKAQELKERYLRTLGHELGMSISDSTIDAVISDRGLATSLALAAYGRRLLERARSGQGHAADLVLWRQFAWEPTGAPKKKFKLSAEMIVEAEKAVVTRLQNPLPPAASS